jgi:Lipopolysaccharide kinase (Kdo/WaaP) family
MYGRRLHPSHLPNMAILPLPPGFVEQTHQQETWWLKAGYESLIPAAIHQLAETQQQSTRERASTQTITPLRWGRGHVWRVQTDAQEVVIVRSYRRGGWVRHLVSDVYWDRPPRPLAELVATETARQRGVPTIEVIGAYVRWMKSGLYRGLLISREAEGFHNLWEWLQTRPAGPTRTETLSAVARTITTMHDAGIVHADLNLMNILVRPRSPSSHVLLLDFDRAQVLSDPVPRPQRGRTLRRLQRSFRKLNPDGALYSADDLALLCTEPSP